MQDGLIVMQDYLQFAASTLERIKKSTIITIFFFCRENQLEFRI